MLETRIPKKLVKGDTIGLIAPSSDISKEVCYAYGSSRF